MNIKTNPTSASLPLPLSGEPETILINFQNKKFMKKYDRVRQSQEFIKEHFAKSLAVFFWIITLITYNAITRYYGISNTEMLREIYHLISHPNRGFLILLGLYFIRPLFFFPLGLLSGLCGAVFGLGYGFLIASI